MTRCSERTVGGGEAGEDQDTEVSILDRYEKERMISRGLSRHPSVFLK